MAAASGPTAAIAASRRMPALTASFTTGGTPRTWSRTYPTPVGASTDATSERSLASTSFHVAWSAVRRVPRRTPLRGMALAAWPASTAPHTSTVPERGSTWRVNSRGS